MRIDRISITPLLLATLFCTTRDDAAGQHPATHAAHEDTIPFTLVGGRPHVQVWVNGQGPFDFGLDTGAEGIGRADSLLVAALGLPAVGTRDMTDGVTTREQVTVRIDSLRFGGVTLRDVEIPSRHYGRRSVGGAPLMGILGRGFFAGQTLTIDYARSEIRVSDARLDARDSHTVGYERPFRVPLRLGDQDRIANVDTGFNEGLHVPLADTAHLSVAGLATGEGSTTQNRLVVHRGTVSTPITLAGNRIDPLEVAFTDRIPDLMIGYAVLRHFVVSFDQRSRLIRIAPAE